MTKFKLVHGTPDFFRPSLCDSCRESQVMKGRTFNEEITLCHANGSQPFRILRPVMECSEYDDKSAPSLWQLEKIAWRIDMDNSSKPIGFLSPKAWKSLHKDDDDD